MFAKRVALIIAFVCIAAGASYSAVPPMISYQGRLTQPSGAPVADGTYSMLFSIYAAPTGGSPLWSETNPSVAVKGGLFSTMLGSVINLPANVFDSPTRYFAVKAGSEPEMTPRQQIASIAFASRANVAGTVDDGAITAPKLATAVATPAGCMSMLPGSSVPSGWLLCDGSAKSRTTYSALFSTIGTAYGAGDGSTTFNLPDMRQRFPLGKTASGTGAVLGQVGGTIDHKHRGGNADGGDLRATIGSCNSDTRTLGFISRDAIDPDTGANTGNPAYVVYGPATSGGYFNHYTYVVGHTGTSNPPYMAVNYIIKY